MNSGFIYYYKKTFKNRIKTMIRKPLKSLGTLLLGLFWIYYPFLFKNLLEGVGFNNPKGYIAVVAGVSIFLGLPGILSYFKRKGLIFNESDINFIFTSPISPKSIIVHGMMKNILTYIIQYIIYFVAAIFIFKVSLIKALIITITGIIISNIINISLAVIMYGSEKLTAKQKDYIKIVVYILLGLLFLFMLYTTSRKSLSSGSFIDFLTGNLIMMIPIFGWEIGFLKLIILGPDKYNIIATVLYFISAIVLFIKVKNMDIVGDYYEEALSYSEDYTKAIKKSKEDGGINFVGKNKKYKKIKFSTKGRLSKAIFYKQIDEMKKLSFLSKYGRVLIYFLLSIAAGLILRGDKDIDANPLIILTATYVISSYFIIFFGKKSNWKKEFKMHYIYLIPDTTIKKVLYSTILETIKSLVEGFLLATPIVILMGLPIYNIFLCAIIYFLINTSILYIDLMIKEIISKKIGNMVADILMLFVDSIFLLIGGGIIFLLGFIIDNIFATYMGLSIYLILLSAIGLFLSSKLYANMEFVNEE